MEGGRHGNTIVILTAVFPRVYMCLTLLHVCFLCVIHNPISLQNKDSRIQLRGQKFSYLQSDSLSLLPGTRTVRGLKFR